jgi:hypothetical protein
MEEYVVINNKETSQIEVIKDDVVVGFQKYELSKDSIKFYDAKFIDGFIPTEEIVLSIINIQKGIVKEKREEIEKEKGINAEVQFELSMEIEIEKEEGERETIIL